jgi:hypothetical protein
MDCNDKVIAHLFNCSNCGYETAEYPSLCCFYPQNEPVIYYKDELDYLTKPDSYNIYNQCKSCGRKNGSALKKNSFNKSKLNYFDKNIVEKTELLKQQLRKELKEIESRRI